ncbi:hypothetical protein BDF22DRAFT_745809 [Syncephalis plumigaleata]|nr:hypothetical protein BDF22DRAFT_745809 [Syncephalis plumigaleata]
MTTTAEVTNNVSNGELGVASTTATNGLGHTSTESTTATATSGETAATTGTTPQGVLNRGWSFPGKQAAAPSSSSAHAPIRSSPLAAKDELAAIIEGGDVVTSSSLAVPSNNADISNIQRVSSPLDQLLAKRAAAAASRPGFGAHRRSESLSSTSGPPPGLGAMPSASARPRFRPAHGRSTSLSLPGAAPGLGGGLSGMMPTGLTSGGASALTRQPLGPNSGGGIHGTGLSKPRSGTFQRDQNGNTGFQPGHLTSASLSHAFGSSILTSSWGKEGGANTHAHHHHSQSHHFGHSRVASIGTSSPARNMDELVDRDIGDGVLGNVVRTLDSLGLKEESATTSGMISSNSLGLGARPVSHRTRSRSLLGGSAATNAAVLGDVSPSGAALHRPSGVSNFLKAHSRPRAISLDYFNPADFEDEADLLAESHRSSQQGSPTDANFGFDFDETTAGERQTPTRSLWIGNLPAHVTSTDLMQIFSAYGAVESLRVLPDRDCAFINYQQVEDASRAHDDMRGARLGGSLIRVGFGKADVYGTDMQGMQPTRALWIGNISPHTTTQILQQIFTPFGAIESVRVLTHKNCGFVNFERTEDAMRAKSVMNGQEIAGAIVRIGFAKVPALELTPGAGATSAASTTTSGLTSRGKEGGQTHIVNANFSFPPTKNNTASGAGASSMAGGHGLGSKGANDNGVTGIEVPSEGFDGKPLALQADLLSYTYAPALPALPPVNPHRRIDASRLRDIRKRLDAHPTAKDIESAFNDLYPEAVELSFDYIGNTVIQKLAEHGTDAQKLQLLEKVAPHFASIGVHKNGTWAVQKMIDTANTPEQMEAICKNIKAYAPPLLLDQFGNYVVQCCLRFGDQWNQFIFDAMHVRCWEIAQGRFGARSMRTCLENEYSTKEQKKHVATSIAFYAIQLTTSANGSLLINWLLDSSELPGRFQILVPRYISQLAQLGVHKLASATLLKVINQSVEPEARNLLLKALFGEVGSDVNANDQPRILEAILEDQTHGVNLIHKIFTSTFIDEATKKHIGARTRVALGRLSVHISSVHRRLADDITALIGQPAAAAAAAATTVDNTIQEESESSETIAVVASSSSSTTTTTTTTTTAAAATTITVAVTSTTDELEVASTTQ